MTDYTPLTSCLACGSGVIEPFFSLGEQALANSFHDGRQEQKKYPLQLNVCPVCFHVQQSVAVDPEILYSQYAYASGTSATLRQYFKDFVLKCEAERPYSGPFHVLDIASNDGSLLKEFQSRGHSVMGVDPSQLADDACAAGIPTIKTFWNENTADVVRKLRPEGFDLIVAMNVLGHVSAPHEFLALCASVLSPKGRILVQTSQAEMVRNAEFDTAYHEHLSFFNVRSFIALARLSGLHIADIRHVPIHGISYLVEITAGIGTEQYVQDFQLGRDEQLLGYYCRSTYDVFAEKVKLHVEHVANTIDLLRREGYAIAGYGAAAKAMTFLNYTGIKLAFMIDDAPLKHGKLCPGNNTLVCREIPISGRIAWIVTAWNFAPELIAKIKAARPNADDKFVTYFPTVEIE